MKMKKKMIKYNFFFEKKEDKVFRFHNLPDFASLRSGGSVALLPPPGGVATHSNL